MEYKKTVKPLNKVSPFFKSTISVKNFRKEVKVSHRYLV